MSAPAPAPVDVLAAERPPAFRRLLKRPEIGALIAAVAVFLVFSAVADSFLRTSSFGTVLYAASTIGIMAVPVSLLMIGGEFDLSAGVLVTTAALTSSMVSYQLTAVTWVGVLVSLLVVLAVSAFNGWMLSRTRLPSFIVTLGTFLMLTGANLGVTKLVTGTVTTKPISDMEGFASCRWLFASEVTVGGLTVKATVWWWLALLLVEQLGAAAHLLRELDLRGGRRRGRRPRGRRAGRPHQDGALPRRRLLRLGARPAPAVLLRHRAVRRRGRQRADLHRRGGHRRLPDHRRLRLDGQAPRSAR